MTTIGLTGGIACGKSTVARMFERLGAEVISADKISREISKPGSESFEQIVAAFGPNSVEEDGSLNRKWIGNRIFADLQARERLEEITHPLILKEIQERVENIRLINISKCVVVEVPLLFEANFQSRFDKIVVVSSTKETQTARLMQRDGLDEIGSDLRIQSQWPLAEKCSRADYVVQNDGSLDDLEKEIIRVWQELCGNAVKKPVLPELGS